ncbi:LPS export ABC transporter permease LptF [Rhodobacter capsulatus]|uniref:Permease YjgP/YjgQ family protein n=1 Tax=Rhodobacter capsulatus (strain ATCC BAA-309 / NBRC 16581 / SB1003) TaxID=272942 RepID=D5AND4_RHOCB|nr:LPS export ABC transporter permease LptF [Rhodobacter capsulatus]ADE86424.1 permease YjgP/YjgQ family protein [Rhodobacter capsulatus SB 1003]ETD00673.1 permease [Rhodobacter capsulatus DE442]ETD75305.1 permease [Rhodobacter capsulatus R121]ETD86294.1 permease [Rhodobacter capsulatus B6]ETD89717.1 permease [Rhodobacter capsulatus YW2]
MKRLDRYLLSQLMAIFGFFALVLVSVYWVNRAVLLFDKLIGDGQTAWVVLEFTALTLPKVISLVLPVAAFAAVLYAINRLSGESELVVMQSAGASPWRLARPVAVFGLIVAALMLALVHELVPASRARLAERQAQVSQDVTARFLTEGSFQTPTAGITVYIREISDLGELLDIFLYDARGQRAETIYTAEKALIVPSEAGPKLVMFDGTAQTLRPSDGSLALTRFSDFTYDLGGAIGTGLRGRIDWEEVPSRDLIAPGPELLAATGSTVAAAHLELNDRLAQPLMAPVAALIAAAAMMLGGFSRLGLWRQIGLAVLALIGLQSLSNVATSMTRADPALWALHYMPALAGLAGVALALSWAGRRRKAPPLTAAEDRA